MRPPGYLGYDDQDALKPIVRAAASANRAATPLFRTSDFLNAVVKGFDIKNRPSLDWGREVLERLDYVAPLANPDQWCSLLAAPPLDDAPEFEPPPFDEFDGSRF